MKGRILISILAILLFLVVMTTPTFAAKPENPGVNPLDNILALIDELRTDVAGLLAKVTNWDTAYGWGDHSAAGYLTSYTETDPVYGASAASDISGTDITDWDTAYGWGDHSAAGYLTSYTETDPVYGASAASDISGTDITDWDTAYGWGDHSAAGYLTSYTETDPVYGASAASDISGTDITDWDTAYGWGDHSAVGYLTGETDPTITDASIKDGVDWTELTGIPADFADGVDDVGGTAGTQYYSVPSNAFFPYENVNYQNYGGMGGAYLDASATQTGMTAPIHLPHGANVTSATLYFYDNSDEILLANFNRLEYDGSGYSNPALAYFSSRDKTGYSNDTDDFSLPHIVDNSTGGYSISAFGDWDGPNLKIVGAVITYTMPGAP
ncbi:hypothetical protein ACFLVN_01675 [Chloroflexota bacterium]